MSGFYNNDDDDDTLEKFYKELTKAEGSRVTATSIQQAATQQAINQAITTSTISPFAASYGTTTITIASDNTITLGDTKINVQELGTMLKHMLEKHKEEFPEYYI